MATFLPSTSLIRSFNILKHPSKVEKQRPETPTPKNEEEKKQNRAVQVRTNKRRSVEASLSFLRVSRVHGAIAGIFIAFTDDSFIASKMPTIGTNTSLFALVRLL